MNKKDPQKPPSASSKQAKLNESKGKTTSASTKNTSTSNPLTKGPALKQGGLCRPQGGSSSFLSSPKPSKQLKEGGVDGKKKAIQSSFPKAGSNPGTNPSVKEKPS
ncbi:unnamed protein product [Linum trigynum]|uniref:Uncharacterized protein n=1 Tax=Linum trigynum TaxID=586398 RepID=A0AAV2GCZ2_9ROSI